MSSCQSHRERRCSSLILKNGITITTIIHCIMLYAAAAAAWSKCRVSNFVSNHFLYDWLYRIVSKSRCMITSYQNWNASSNIRINELHSLCIKVASSFPLQRWKKKGVQSTDKLISAFIESKAKRIRYIHNVSTMNATKCLMQFAIWSRSIILLWMCLLLTLCCRFTEHHLTIEQNKNVWHFKEF